MGSKGRMPPPHLRHPLPGPGIMHPDPYGPGIRPLQGLFPPFDLMPPPEVVEHKLAVQHLEMQRLATENQRLASTHGTLRQELAAAQHELQILQAQIGALKAEREQQMKNLVDKIAKMEAELQTAEPVKLELQQARENAHNLIGVRQELISKVQQLTQDLQRAHSDVQHIPVLMSELDNFRQEYQHCRATYDYEKKLYNDHLESLQFMEKNYMTMAKEVEKLRGELTNTANVDRRIGGPYGGTTGYNENEASGNHPVGQNAYEDGYGAPQGHGPLPVASGGAPVAGASAYVGVQTGPAPTRSGYDAPRVPDYHPQKGPSYDAQRGLSYDAQRGPAPTRTGYDAPRIPSYDAQRGLSYDAQRGPGYGAERGPSFDAPTGSGHDAQKGPNYDAVRGQGFDTQWGHGYEAQRRPNYDASKGASFEASSRGSAGTHGQLAPTNNVSYGSATPPAFAGSLYEAHPHGGNPLRR